jgi:surfactin synthase thioesterase subunit
MVVVVVGRRDEEADRPALAPWAQRWSSIALALFDGCVERRKSARSGD